MLLVEAYGVQLKRLALEDIELVRYWRNSEKIRQYMEFREEITPAMQLKWFNSIDNFNNFYFLISVDNSYIGLINGANTNWDEGVTHSGGIFIWDEKFWATEVPFNASMLLTDISFAFGLKTIRAKILKDNIRSIDFNKKLGFTLTQGQEKLYNQLYELTKPAYDKATLPVREILQKRYGDKIRARFINPLTPAEEYVVKRFKEKSVGIELFDWTLE